MRACRRYAVYYAPEPGPFAAFGAAWLGWDAEAGRAVPHPDVPGLDVAALTRTPRKYGFHGTLKPPFRPTGDVSALPGAIDRLARTIPRFAAPPLRLSRIGPFLALVPSAPCPALEALAAACVRSLDAFRAPPAEAELAKRRAAGLSPRQEALLAAWGYPHVLDEFRFHLTLTGALDETACDAAEAALRPLVAPFCAAPMPVTAITLFGEAEDGRFHILRRFPLAR